jgi:hypothetical protein
MIVDEDMPAPEPEEKPLPLLVCEGEGYVTHKDGTVEHFTFKGEA